jgi:hypothetical protein
MFGFGVLFCNLRFVCLRKMDSDSDSLTRRRKNPKFRVEKRVCSEQPTVASRVVLME